MSKTWCSVEMQGLGELAFGAVASLGFFLLAISPVGPGYRGSPGVLGSGRGRRYLVCSNSAKELLELLQSVREV